MAQREDNLYMTGETTSIVDHVRLCICASHLYLLLHGLKTWSSMVLHQHLGSSFWLVSVLHSEVAHTNCPGDQQYHYSQRNQPHDETNLPAFQHSNQVASAAQLCTQNSTGLGSDHRRLTCMESSKNNTRSTTVSRSATVSTAKNQPLGVGLVSCSTI